VVRGPYVTLSRDFERGSTLSAMVQGGKPIPSFFGQIGPSAMSPFTATRNRPLRRARGAVFVVTTGNGFRKDRGFLLPVFDGISGASAKESGGCRLYSFTP